MSLKTYEIVEQLKTLTALETKELVKKIETVFGVDASPVQIPCIIDSHEPDLLLEPEKTEFDVVIEEINPQSKIAVLKVVREITGLGLKEAKDFVESVPRTLNFGVPEAIASEIKQKLEAVGAVVSLK